MIVHYLCLCAGFSFLYNCRTYKFYFALLSWRVFFEAGRDFDNFNNTFLCLPNPYNVCALIPKFLQNHDFFSFQLDSDLELSRSHCFPFLKFPFVKETSPNYQRDHFHMCDTTLICIHSQGTNNFKLLVLHQYMSLDMVKTRQICSLVLHHKALDKTFRWVEC